MDGQLGGAVDADVGGDLAAQLGHAQILNDKGVHPRLSGGADQFPDAFQLPVGDQSVQSQVHLHAPDVAIAQSLRQCINGEVFGTLPGVEFSHAQIDGIRPVLHRGAQRIHRPRGGQQFQHK